MTKIETSVQDLRINILSEEAYQKALDNNEIKENELYFTPSSESGGGIAYHAGSGIKIENNIISTDNHTLTIGNYKYDGSEDVTVAVYEGDYDNDTSAAVVTTLNNLVSLLSSNNDTNDNNDENLQMSSSGDSMTLLTNENTMTLI